MSLRAFRFRLPLTKPIVLAGQLFSHREGILLQKDGCWSEASPLPGFSNESIDSVISELKAGRCNSPSLQFAMDSLGIQEGTIAVNLNALLQGKREEVIAHAKRLSASTCTAAKLKVGRGEASDVRQAIELVHAVRASLGSEKALRLDANRCWSFDLAAQFLSDIDSANIEYIEEPVDDPNRLEELYAKTKVRYALDETLAEGGSLGRFPNAATLVVKPTMLGRIERIEELAATGKRLVFSAAYESGIGISQIARLAARFSPDVPAGLDTYSWLADDVLMERLVLQDWKLHVSSEFDVRMDRLEEIQL